MYIGLHVKYLYIGLHVKYLYIGLHVKYLYIGLHVKYLYIGPHVKCLYIGLHVKYLYIGLHVQYLYIGLHVKYLIFLPDFNQTSILSTEFRKILTYQISLKSVQWGPSCSMQRDSHDGASNRSSQFANALKTNYTA